MQYNDFKDDLTKIQNEVGVKVHNFDDLDQFENLEDVAALCAALDIVVSTHNVLIMIAPRVGTLTKFASWRQSPWNNILLSPKVPVLINLTAIHGSHGSKFFDQSQKILSISF